MRKTESHIYTVVGCQIADIALGIMPPLRGWGGHRHRFMYSRATPSGLGWFFQLVNVL